MKRSFIPIFRSAFSLQRVRRGITALFLLPIVLFILLNALFPFRPSPDYSRLVLAEDGSALHAFLSYDQKWRMKTEISEIMPALQRAILRKEDRWFYWHFGVNPLAVFRATAANILHLRVTSGASTITMQVARLLEPKPRTVWNKMREMFRAVQLEMRFSKQEILQLYVNLLPYGGNIEGMKAASLLYFGRLPNYLSLAQIVTLTIIPNRPTSLRPGENNDALLRQRNIWLRRFSANAVFSQSEIETALSEPLDIRRSDAPRIAPHFSLRIKSMYPSETTLQTNLNPFVQEKIQTFAFNHIQRWKYYNIHNASVIVIRNSDRSVVGYLGSQNFWDNNFGGQVDGVQAPRSPGSTLKPLVYGLAIDAGFITPKSVITDVPTNFNGYSPENFNQKFNGAVTAEKALAFSLNIPAVKMLDKIGTPALVEKLKQADFRQIKNDERKLGLSMVLGGCGVRLEELANLFCSFANGGLYAPLRWKMSDTSRKITPILSPQSAFILTEILTQPLRPDLPNNYQSSLHAPRIAWKTGTSFGRRDAWSVGFNKRYTVGVWVGNFNGDGVPELTGADVATPLLFEIFNALEYANPSAEWFSPPKGLDFRYVCTETGMPPDDFCENQALDYFLPGISHNRRCQHLKTIFVSENEKFSYCTSCLPQNGYKKKLYPDYPPELLAFYEIEKLSYRKIPPHNPLCARVVRENAPVISSLVNGKEYLLEKDDEQKIALACSADGEVKTIFWYINDRFFKAVSPKDKAFFRPEKAGEYKISCADDRGRNANVWVTVKFF